MGGAGDILSGGLLGKERRSGPGVSIPLEQITTSPGFKLRTEFNPATGSQATRLTQTGSPAQSAFGATFDESVGAFTTLINAVAPGFSAFRESGLSQLRQERDLAVGNIRQSLAERGVFGSLASAQESSTRAEFARRIGQFETETALAEFNATVNALNARSNTVAQAFDREVALLGIAKGVAANFGQLLNSAQAIKAQALFNDEQIRLGRQQLTRDIINDVASFAGGFAASSKLIKENFEAIDILELLEDLPIEKWSYTGESERHVGPYAEDVAAIFGVGDGHHINLLDLLGITLGAVKELREEVRDLKEQIDG